MITEAITRDNLSEILIDLISDEKGITQVKIANGTGIDRNTISAIVNGSKPQAITVNRIKKYLKSTGYYVEKK